MAEKQDQRCMGCNAPGNLHELEVATAYGLQVIRCVDPIVCRERAQKLGIWKTVEV